MLNLCLNDFISIIADEVDRSFGQISKIVQGIVILKS